MSKPFDLRVFETRDALFKTLFNAQLPASVLILILDEVRREVEKQIVLKVPEKEEGEIGKE